MLVTLSIDRLSEALEQATGIGRNTKQVSRLLKRVVVRSRHEDGIAPLRGDLDRLAVVVHLLDQREKALPRFARGYGHSRLLSHWYVIWYQCGFHRLMSHDNGLATACLGSGTVVSSQQWDEHLCVGAPPA